MKLKRKWIDNTILIIGTCLFLWILSLPKYSPAWVYSDTIKYASVTLKGQIPFSDFVQEVVGFRALYNKTDPYPVLGPAIKGLGIDWDVVHGSSHPPTSFLLAAPVAFFPWPVASALWAWLMLCLIVFSYRFYGLSWKLSLGLMPLTLLWPPASASLGQITIIWMFGLAMAYYFRAKRLFWSGASVGLASMTKIFPALMMIIFLVKRRWTAILGFISVLVLALSLIILLNPAAIPRYIEEQFITRRVHDTNNPSAAPITTASFTVQRSDNSAPLIISYRYGGTPGLILLILFLSAIVFVNRRYFYEWRIYPSTRLWMLLSYFSVIFLPLFWIYSLMPLLPVMAFLLLERKIVTTIIVLYSVLIPSVYIRGGDESVIPIASVTIFLGLAFILDLLPLKIFQRKWNARLLTEDQV